VTGVLKAKINGVWVPLVDRQGPEGAAGAQGTSGNAPLKGQGRAYSSYLTYATNLAAAANVLSVSTNYYNSGWTVISSTNFRVTAAGRFAVNACISISGSPAGNWMILNVDRYQSSDNALLGSYGVVAANNTSAARSATISIVLDLNALDYLQVKVQPDVAGPLLMSSRAHISMSEVVW